MCKILAMAGIRKDLSQLAWDFVSYASNEMTKEDRDGFGYAALTPGRDLFGEKWTDVEKRFLPNSFIDEPGVYKTPFFDAVTPPEDYVRFGVKETRISAIIAHSRLATCGRELENVHPFVRNGIALVHNGIIFNTLEHEKVVSSCDSESLLTLYLQEDVRNAPAKIQAVSNELVGSYAAAVLHSDGLDVFRNSMAELVVAWVEELKTWVFATTKEILEAGAHGISSTLGPVLRINPGHLLRLHPLTGKVVAHERFEERVSDFQRRQYESD